jgi:hypothetical protein
MPFSYFLDLLKGEVDVTAEYLLRHVYLDAPHPDAASDVDIYRIWRLSLVMRIRFDQVVSTG